MASINEKLNYINETKSLIKDKLNDLGSEIEDETTFREYAEKIKDLYDEWPKINDEDTTITLNNTKKGKAQIQLKGNIKQDTTTGKNKFNKNNITSIINGILEDDILESNAISSNYGGVSANLQNTILNAGTYYVSMEVKIKSGVTSQKLNTIRPSGSSSVTVTMITNPNLSNDYQIYASRIECSEETSITNILIQLGTNNSDGIIQIKNIMISTSSDTTYESYTGGIASPNPDYPQDIKVVTGENAITISNEDNTESQTFNINLGDLELCKIEEYQDYIYKENNKWYLYKKIDKIILKGNENHIGINQRTNGYQFDFVNSSGINGNNNKIFMLSQNFKGIKFDDRDSYSESIYSWSNDNRIRILTTVATTIEGFKTWLSTHNTTVYYILATATNNEITDSILINQLNTLEQAISYNNQTNISQENDNLPFIIKASALMKNSD